MPATTNLALLVVMVFGCGIRDESTAKSPAHSGGSALAPSQIIPLPDVEGRIDHFAIDAKGKRLFMAALGNNTVEVIDMAAGKVVARIHGLAMPQGVSFAPDANRLAIANDKDGTCGIYDGNSLRQVASVDLKDDADNVRYDSGARLFWVGYGHGGLAAIDPFKGMKVADVKLDGHPESFQLEANGNRIFVNVPDASHVAVVDRDKRQVIARWPLKEASANFPMALDEAHHRIFVGCRRPAKVLVLDSDSGKVVATVDVVGDMDDMFYDGANDRLYVSGGEGKVTVLARASADTYRVTGEIETEPGARTSFFDPSSGMLYVASPHRGTQRAEVRAFKPAAIR